MHRLQGGKNKTTEKNPVMEAMDATMIDMHIDAIVATAFDGTDTGSTRATRVGDRMFVVLSGGVVWSRPVAELILRLKMLTSPTLEDCSRAVLEFVTEMERAGVSVSELVAGDQNPLCGASVLEELTRTTARADQVAPRLSPPSGSSVSVWRAAVVTGSLLQTKQHCDKAQQRYAELAAHVERILATSEQVPSHISPAFGSYVTA